MLLRFSRKGRVAMAGGAMGAVAVWQWKRRRPAPAPAAAVEPDPARELRARLDESRAPAAEPTAPTEPTAQEEADPAARRQSVHEEARARIDGLKNDDNDKE